MKMKMLSLSFSILSIFFWFSQTKANILFEEKFEDNNFASRGWYDGAGGTLSDIEHLPGSNFSFECKYQKGDTGCKGGNPGRRLFEETEIVYLTYFVKYSKNWEGSNRSYHPHEFYFTTNKDGKYVGPAKSRLTTYIEQNEGTPRIAIQDSLNVDENCIKKNNNDIVGCNGNFDSYNFTESRSVASCNGLIGDLDERDCYNTGSYWYSSRGWSAKETYFRDNPGKYYKNDWHCIEVMFNMNSIQKGVGIPDGKIRLWFDEELIISYDNILLRTGEFPDMKFSQFLILPYIGPGSPVEQTMWIDNLTISTHRINKEVNDKPLPPVNLHIIN